MANLITSICKYTMTIVIIVYTILAFWVLKYKSVEDTRSCYWGMNILTFVLLSSGFIVIALNEKDMTVVVFYAAIVAYMLIYLLVYRLIYKKANLALLSHMMMLLSIGFIILTRLYYSRSIRQFIFVVVGSVIMLVVPKMFAKLKAARVWAMIMGAIGLLLLGMVLVLGKVTGGANLSLDLKFFTFQPSEFVKISFVLLIAVMLRNRTDVKRVLLASAVALVHGGILVASNDLGAALIYCMAYLMMLYVATKKPIILGLGVVTGAGASVLAYMLFSHVQTRVKVWLDPWALFDGKGRQVANSLLGIATGGWFGQGLYKGKPKLIYVVDQDFVFAAICEELGGVIGLCLILICIACLLMFIRVAADLYLPFYKLIGVGLSTIYGTQVFLTIGGSVKFIPSTGVTLPLVSYGGSSILSTFIILGIMHELYIKHQNEVERLERSKDRFVWQADANFKR